jgi:hypothetical protein
MSRRMQGLGLAPKVLSLTRLAPTATLWIVTILTRPTIDAALALTAIVAGIIAVTKRD